MAASESSTACRCVATCATTRSASTPTPSTSSTPTWKAETSALRLVAGPLGAAPRRAAGGAGRHAREHVGSADPTWRPHSGPGGRRADIADRGVRGERLRSVVALATHDEHLGHRREHRNDAIGFRIVVASQSEQAEPLPRLKRQLCRRGAHQQAALLRAEIAEPPALDAVALLNDALKVKPRPASQSGRLRRGRPVGAA